MPLIINIRAWSDCMIFVVFSCTMWACLFFLEEIGRRKKSSSDSSSGVWFAEKEEWKREEEV